MAKKKKKSNEVNFPFGFVAVILLVVAVLLGTIGFLAFRESYFPKKVFFPKTQHTMCVGDVAEMPATIQPVVKNNTLVYKSSDVSVASVTQNGVITAIGEGECVISAEHTFSKMKAVMKITVEKPVLRIEISKDKATLNEGDTIGVNAVISSTGFAVVNLEYTSSDENVCEVNSDGIITAKDVGSAVVTVVEKESGASAKMDITVIAPLKDMYFKTDSVDIMVDETYQPPVVFAPADASDQKVEYSISPEAVAVVGKNGKVRGVSGGSAVLTVTHKSSGKTAKMRINVYEQVKSIKLNKNQLMIKVGESANVLAEVNPALAKDKTLSWTSSDKSVAFVSVSGAGTCNIKGVAEGTCKIIATSNSNPEVSAELLVTVEKSENHTITQETYIDGILVVNKTYGLPKDYNSGGGLTAETKSAFAKMKQDASKEGIELRIVSGYRSYDYQKNLFNKYLNRPGETRESVESYSARPGYSEHHTGLAIDVNNASSSFVGTPEQKWLNENCVKYGFIIRYPEGKEQYTGYKYEPWHIRYLGVETAQKVYESGLCLEEYLNITSQYSF